MVCGRGETTRERNIKTEITYIEMKTDAPPYYTINSFLNAIRNVIEGKREKKRERERRVIQRGDYNCG